MNAIEIRGLRKNFGSRQALKGLDMTVPEGAVYGFIGENGSGKSTTEKIITGLLQPTDGEVKLYGRSHTDPAVRAGIGVLIEAPGCYADYSVWNNMMLQALNLGISNPKKEIARVLKLVRMEGAASNKYKNCSLGMKQRVGIAMALLGNPRLLILDEPINGLDADGMRIMRQILADITADKRCSVLISSHILGELEKSATHYGIIKDGRMLAEMTRQQLYESCRTYTALKTDRRDMERAKDILKRGYARVSEDESGFIRIYDAASAEAVVKGLYANEVVISEIKTERVSLEEFYMDLMTGSARGLKEAI